MGWDGCGRSPGTDLEDPRVVWKVWDGYGGGCMV